MNVCVCVGERLIECEIVRERQRSGDSVCVCMRVRGGERREQRKGMRQTNE